MQRKWVLLVPVVAVLLLSPLATIAQDGSQIHVVQSGENLFRIALRYGLTVDEIATANGIADPTQIYAGQRLTIPSANSIAAVEESSEQPPAANNAPLYHIVQSGETLASIGLRYGVAWADLATWNDLTNPNQIYAGQRLVVSSNVAPDAAAVAGPTIVELTPSVEAVAEVPLATELADPVGAVETNEALPFEIASAPLTPNYRRYFVRQGDTLSNIAQRYGLSWTTIARANNITDPSRIAIGQELMIPASDDDTGTYLEPTGGMPAAPAPTTDTGKEIIVDLTNQQIHAFENGVLLRSLSVSTGMAGTPTVVGDFRIYWKLTSQTMTGEGYYLPGVPWVMYFHQDYAIHGTYWHNNFGQPMSHGCVNLPTGDAEWFFRWAEVGTPVRVHY